MSSKLVNYTQNVKNTFYLSKTIASGSVEVVDFTENIIYGDTYLPKQKYQVTLKCENYESDIIKIGCVCAVRPITDQSDFTDDIDGEYHQTYLMFGEKIIYSFPIIGLIIKNVSSIDISVNLILKQLIYDENIYKIVSYNFK